MPSKNTSDAFFYVAEELAKQTLALSRHQLEMSKNLNLIQCEINEIRAQISFLAENHAHILEHIGSEPIPRSMIN